MRPPSYGAHCLFSEGKKSYTICSRSFFSMLLDPNNLLLFPSKRNKKWTFDAWKEHLPRSFYRMQQRREEKPEKCWTVFYVSFSQRMGKVSCDRWDSKLRKSIGEKERNIVTLCFFASRLPSLRQFVWMWIERKKLQLFVRSRGIGVCSRCVSVWNSKKETSYHPKNPPKSIDCREKVGLKLLNYKPKRIMKWKENSVIKKKKIE